MTWGLVVPDTSNPFFAQLSRAIEEAAFARGYTLLIGNAAEDDDRQTTYVRTFLARQVDGLFLVPAHGPTSVLAELQRSEVPWVALDRSAGGAPAVLADNRGGAREHSEDSVPCDRWREQFDVPDAPELDDSELPDPPAGWPGWAEWATDRWPSLADG